MRRHVTHGVLALLLLAALPARAQLPFVEQRHDPEISMTLRYSRPGPLLRDANYRQGVGFEMQMLGAPQRLGLPLFLQAGASFSYDAGGSEKLPVTYTFPEPVSGDLLISNFQVGGHAVAQLSTSPALPVQLYAQGLLGGRMFVTHETFTPEGISHDTDDDCPEPVALARSFTLSYGAGGGMRIRLSEYARLDLRAQYLHGGYARFVDLETVRPSTEDANRILHQTGSAVRSNGWFFGIGLTLPMSGGCGSSCGSERSTFSDFSSGGGCR